MSLLRIALIAQLVIISVLAFSLPQDLYYPPPSVVDYHDDTLSIFPPDSLPGEPVILLGYNIYVDSVFYDNVMVENQTDTVDFIADFSTLYPGNHEFCVYAVYNQWISDPACDSALVIYGYELPFFEDWFSGNFTQNQWITDSGNWTVEAEEGNPGPSAVFSGSPAQYDYQIPLESFGFKANNLHVGKIWLTYNIKLNSINSTGSEALILQRYNWNSNLWQDVGYYSNGEGSFIWTSEQTTLFSIHDSGPVFKIRFVATGSNSADISSWSIDNIHISRTCLQATDLIVDEFFNYNELFWSIPTGCGPDWIRWDDGQNSGTSVGTGDVAEFDVAARWNPAQLASYIGLPINAVAFFPAEINCEYSIRLWTGDSIVDLIYDQLVAVPQIGEWNIVDLDSGILIDATKDLYVGYHANAYTGYPAGVDDGPAINGYGNMMYWENTWRSLLEINPELDYNWNIACRVGPDPNLPDRHFRIYRETNGMGGFQLINSVFDDATYNDYNIYLPDIYCYKVTMVWTNFGDTCESTPTNEACETIWLSANSPEHDPQIKLYPNPARGVILIESERNIQQIRLFSLLGELILERDIEDDQYILDVSALKNGLYFLEVEAGNKMYQKKIVKI